ncbi:hypothetical protein [Ferrovibrio sp.]|uniref:hypothetical protein n=1 Tax=Ferrovibrio sp. TaxID=1917215 RepID=UPI00391D618E
MMFFKNIGQLLNSFLDRFGYRIVNSKRLVDFYLHKYKSYEEYKAIQIQHNIRKISKVWADQDTLSLMCSTLKKEMGSTSPLRGLCHGSRNGFEQKFISSVEGFYAIGTDISPTATDYENSVQWDFHEVNEDWVGKFDFVYSNSLDQSWNPRAALAVWLNQVHVGGCVVIEHTEAHGPMGASEMDPFGVRPSVMPYILAEWFGFNISIQIIKSKKGNMDRDVWLFFIKKLSEVVN